MFLFSNFLSRADLKFSSAIPFAFMSHFVGLNVVAPLYFAIYVYNGQSRLFYFPWPRAIDIKVAKVIPISLIITYMTPLVLTISGCGDNFSLASWAVAHISLPVVTALISRVLPKFSSSIDQPRAVFASLDLLRLDR